MTMKRREFLEQTLSGLGAAAVAAVPQTGWSETASSFSTDPTALVPLTDRIQVSRVGMGTGVRAGMRQSNLTRMDHEQAVGMIRFCYEQGIRYFDMADTYGTHSLVAEALEGCPRNGYALGTKLWCHAGGIPEQERLLAEDLIERLLRELKTDYIDLIQLHCMVDDQWTTRFSEQMESLDRLKQKGLIRAHGVSCHSLAAIRLAAAEPWTDVIHGRLNTAGACMDGSWDDTVAAFQAARANGKGVIIMKLIGEGSITDPEERRKSADAVTRLDCKNMMIVGFEKKEHVTEFLDNVRHTLEDMARE